MWRGEGEGKRKSEGRGEEGGGGGRVRGVMGKGLVERSGEVGVTEGGLVGEEQCDKETERERKREKARPRDAAYLA